MAVLVVSLFFESDEKTAPPRDSHDTNSRLTLSFERLTTANSTRRRAGDPRQETARPGHRRMKCPREKEEEEGKRGERFSSTLVLSRAVPAATHPLASRHPFAHEPGIRLVCALITLLESPPSLATLEINGSLPIVTVSYMGKGQSGYLVCANERARSLFPSQPPLVIPHEHRFFMRSSQKERERHRTVRCVRFI